MSCARSHFFSPSNFESRCSAAATWHLGRFGPAPACSPNHTRNIPRIRTSARHFSPCCACARSQLQYIELRFMSYFCNTHSCFCFCSCFCFYFLALAHSSSAHLVTACSGRCNGQCSVSPLTPLPSCRDVLRRQRRIVRLLRLLVTRVCCRCVLSANPTSSTRRLTATWG